MPSNDKREAPLAILGVCIAAAVLLVAWVFPPLLGESLNLPIKLSVTVLALFFLLLAVSADRGGPQTDPDWRPIRPSDPKVFKVWPFRVTYKVAFDGRWQGDFDSFPEAEEWAQAVSETDRLVFVLSRRLLRNKLVAVFPTDRSADGKHLWESRAGWDLGGWVSGHP